MNEKLAFARMKKGWSQQEAADAAQVAVRTYQRWEHGKCVPNFASRRLLRNAFGATEEELGFGLPHPQSMPDPGEAQQVARLTHQELVALAEILEAGGNLLDEAKRNTLRKLLALIGASMGVSLVYAASEPVPAPQLSTVGNSPDLDLIGSYTEALQELLAKGEAQYVMRASQSAYYRLLQEYPYSKDVSLVGTQLRLGMLVAASQEYALPWYQRDQAIIQTYNQIENAIIRNRDVCNPSLQHGYAQLLAKRGRQHRVLWQFEECVKECEDGLASLREIDDSSLRTHFLCERAHIEATRGDEPLWMRKLAEARLGALDMKPTDREKALNQVVYMQGEGYKRFAFQTQKEFPLSVREHYARLALKHFTQWNGATIELAGFESLVAQVSKAQCLILLDPDEALHLAGQMRKRAEQRYPALLDKIQRVVFLSQQRLQMKSSEFLEILREPAYRAGRNVL